MTQDTIIDITETDEFKSWKKEKGLIQIQPGKGWYFDSNGNPISDMTEDIVKLFLLNKNK
jgi:hypothetical protein